MQRLKLGFRLGLLAAVVCLLGLLAACDPLAPDSKPIVVVVTQTPTRTRVPSPVAVSTSTLAPSEAATSESPGTSEAIGTPGTGLIATATLEPGGCDEPTGQVVDLSFASKAAKTTVNYRAYLPPCYTKTARRYPYAILLPGSDGDETEWTATLKVNEALDTGIAIHALPPMVLIMPNGGDLMNLNAFQTGGSWESVIMDELMPEVEKTFCTWNTREGRAIGGISRGGFWAFEIGLRHPNVFSAIGGHSAYFDAENAPPEFNPLGLAKIIKFAPGAQPRFWLDVAKDDDVRPNIEVFQKTLAGRNIDAGYTMNPIGQHKTDYWAAHISEYLAFYGQTWPRSYLDLPSCLE